jgi:hypothetical protein
MAWAAVFTNVSATVVTTSCVMTFDENRVQRTIARRRAKAKRTNKRIEEEIPLAKNADNPSALVEPRADDESARFE